jgi:hypothetical protein
MTNKFKFLFFIAIALLSVLTAMIVSSLILNLNREMTQARQISTVVLISGASFALFARLTLMIVKWIIKPATVSYFAGTLTQADGPLFLAKITYQNAIQLPAVSRPGNNYLIDFGNGSVELDSHGNSAVNITRGSVLHVIVSNANSTFNSSFC